MPTLPFITPTHKHDLSRLGTRPLKLLLVEDPQLRALVPQLSQVPYTPRHSKPVSKR